MDPSYNNTFNSVSQAPISSGSPNSASPRAISSGGVSPASPTPISSGTGDIILTPDYSSSGKKSKKGLIIGIIVAILILLIGTFTVLIGTGIIKIGETEEEKRSQFHSLLEEHIDGVIGLSTLMDGVFGGKISMGGFMMSDDGYAEMVTALDDAIMDLNTIKDRLRNGPELTGTINEIDISKNYQNLKNAIERDSGTYERFVSMTKGICEVFKSRGELKAVDLLAEYNGASNLAIYIDDYFTLRTNASAEYEENGCVELQNEICEELEKSSEEFNKGFIKNTEVIRSAYYSVFGEFPYSGENSIEWFLNNLYVATEVVEERSNEE
ncbi:MAG: hypothetical protein Q4B65_00720 [Candidatus Saccharibacteria bacterium]|nr:hypothetical protein [Candidatus Saccharibacteria bacterium]